MARNVMEQIVEHGKVTRAYLGIVPQDVTPDIARQFGENDARGALVADVSAGSPAQKSGLERGDIILDVNGKPVADSNALRMLQLRISVRSHHRDGRCSAMAPSGKSR
jgi:serine protease Do